MADIADLGTGLVEELGRERTAAHTGAISLEDTIHLADTAGSKTETCACAGSYGIA